MLSIFVCEDNPRYLGIISKCIKNYLFIEELDFEIALSTSEPTEIIQLYKK